HEPLRLHRRADADDLHRHPSVQHDPQLLRDRRQLDAGGVGDGRTGSSMRAITDQRGFTLIEVLIASTISLIVLAAAVSAIGVFMRSNASQERRNEDQASARLATDRLASELRNVAAPGVAAAGVLEQAGPYSIVFQTVDASQAASQ